MIPAKFDELIHAPTRLAIVSLLAAAEWADFKFLRDNAQLSDSALSKQLTILETAGYVEIRKGFVGKRTPHLGPPDHGRAGRVSATRRGATADRVPGRHLGCYRNESAGQAPGCDGRPVGWTGFTARAAVARLSRFTRLRLGLQDVLAEAFDVVLATCRVDQSLEGGLSSALPWSALFPAE
jgi:DNA-binding transcriptional ArsR family regulator